jgi:hypothetical protein
LTSLQDQYFSRISLLIDGGGSGIWGDAIQNFTEDIQVTAAAPRADESYNGIVTHSGQDIQPLGLVYDSGVTDYGVSAEFLIPITTVNGNSTSGLGLALIVSQGGFDSYFPIGYSADETLIIIKNAGLRARFPIDFLVLAVTLIVFLAAISISTMYKPTESANHIMSILPDEELERIRTLIYSHPEISLDRLTLLANTDRESVNVAIDKLIQDDTLLLTIVVSEGIVTRIESISEKKQK